MLGLTLHTPWAQVVAKGIKAVENRGWRPLLQLLPLELAIHAGETYDEDGARFIRDLGVVPPSAGDCPGGVILATAKVVEVLHVEMDPMWRTTIDLWRPGQSQWGFGPWVWLLDEITPIEPVRCRGARRLWTLPAEVEAEVRRRRGEVLAPSAVAGGGA